MIDKEYVRCGEVISLGVGSHVDWDRCTVTSPPCSFPNNEAGNTTTIVGWDDGGAGGTFGHLDANNQFVAGAPITHYQASPTNPGVVHLRAQLDDNPTAEDPVTHQQVPTYDEQPWWTT